MDDTPGHPSAAPPEPLPLVRFESMVEAYGARPERWPAAERPAALALLRQSEAARSLRREAAKLDAALDRLRPPLPSPGLGHRLKRRGPAGARARLRRAQKRTRIALPSARSALAYAAVALIAFIIGFTIAWPLRDDPAGLSGPMTSQSTWARDEGELFAVPLVDGPPAAASAAARDLTDRPDDLAAIPLD